MGSQPPTDHRPFWILVWTLVVFFAAHSWSGRTDAALLAALFYARFSSI